MCLCFIGENHVAIGYKGLDMESREKTTFLALAFHLLGGIYGIADKLEVCPNTTRCWKRNGYLPKDKRAKKYAEEIEKRTGGLVKASRLLDESREKYLLATKSKKNT